MLPSPWQPLRKRLPDQVSDQLKSRILQGLYPPGSRLPSERILAEELGVTRLTLREALKTTEEAGFTETRHGAGTFARDVWNDGNLQVLGEILTAQRALAPDEVRSLLEFRLVMAPGFAPAIARNHRPEHIEALRTIIEREREQLDDPNALIALDFDFQAQLAAASGNRIFCLLVQSIKPAYLYLSQIVYEAVPSFEPIVLAHESITRTVEAGDPERLRQEITFFVTCGNDIIEQFLAAHDAAPGRTS